MHNSGKLRKKDNNHLAEMKEQKPYQGIVPTSSAKVSTIEMFWELLWWAYFSWFTAHWTIHLCLKQCLMLLKNFYLFGHSNCSTLRMLKSTCFFPPKNWLKNRRKFPTLVTLYFAACCTALSIQNFYLDLADKGWILMIYL